MSNRLYSSISFLLLSALLIAGFVLSALGNYGGDNDTYGMLHTFLSILNDRLYVPSRYTGYPVAEIGLGTLAYFGGAAASNVATFSLQVAALVLFYLALTPTENDIVPSRFALFSLLTLSNPAIFFDSVITIDYSSALFFFSLGLFLLAKSRMELAVLAFGCAIGSRISFTPFVVVAVMLFDYSVGNAKQYNLTERLRIAFASWFIGGLFYLPVWISSGFSLDWLTSARPLFQGFYGIVIRFLYKIYLAVGCYSSIVLLIGGLYLISTHKNEPLSIGPGRRFLLGLFAVNLAIFLYIPVELSYLQPALIVLYLLLSRLKSPNIALAVIAANFISWFVSFSPLAISRQFEDRCATVVAVGAQWSPHFSEGRLDNFFSSQEMVLCYNATFPDSSDVIVRGGPLRLLKAQ